MPAITVIKLRRGTAAEWTAANPVLAAGEEGHETDTGSRKVGNGLTAWNSLAYFASVDPAAVVLKSIVDAKGDLVAATAADTVARLAVGANDYVLTADSAAASGLKWAAAPGGADATKVPITQTQTAGTALNAYKVQPSNVARGPFNFTVFDDGSGNHVGYWGYNAAEQGGKFLSSEHAFKWVHESAFGSWSESYTEYLSPDGTVNFRPWFFVIDKVTNVVQTHEFVGPPFTFKTIAGAGLLDLTATGVLRTYGAPATDPTWQIHADAGRSAGFAMYAAGVQNFILTSVDANLTQIRMNAKNIAHFHAGANVSGLGMGDSPAAIGGIVSVAMDLMVGAPDAGKYYAGITTRGCATPREFNDHWRMENSAGDTVLGRFNKHGFFITKKTAAIPDADLNANEMALWFDSTNGAAKLMVKAKQADGTVRTGSVSLA